MNLDIAKAEGQQGAHLTDLEANFTQKHEGLLQYLEQHRIMTQSELMEKIRNHIRQIQKNHTTEKRSEDEAKKEEERRRKEQEQKIKESIIDGSHMVFHPIKPGEFIMGDKENGMFKNKITKPFDMMATQTTQVIWRKVTELAQKEFEDKYKELILDPSYFKGDLKPVETVSYEDVGLWISALNELSQMGHTGLKEVILSHKQGHTYRFLTEAEWDFVVKGRGQYNEAYHFGRKKSDLGELVLF